MSSTFTGFSEEDLQRMKSVETGLNMESIVTTNIKKAQIGVKQKRPGNQYKVPLQNQSSDEAIDIMFDKCRLSLKNKPTTEYNNNASSDLDNISTSTVDLNSEDDVSRGTNDLDKEMKFDGMEQVDNRKSSTGVTPDLVNHVDEYSEEERAAHGARLEELQLRQRLMEEQNKKRKEMLAKALADRTKQTAEEVVRLEKIKKELQVLDGQFSHDVAVLRSKIDHACLSYADAEKHYLKVEKEFLQAKINLQKEKEKKELLTEHLCALITHNETRKAQKLETLMLELASDRRGAGDAGGDAGAEESGAGDPGRHPGAGDPGRHPGAGDPGRHPGGGDPGRHPGAGDPGRHPGAGDPGRHPGGAALDDDDSAVVVDGVCEKTGKMVEL